MATPATILVASEAKRAQAISWIKGCPWNSWVALSPPRRTVPQNSRLHCLITDVACQVEWPIGSGTRRDVEAWKDIFTAALRSSKHGLDVVPGINGGFVLLGMHTSRMSKEEVGDLMELIAAFGAEHGVVFTEPKLTEPATEREGVEA